MKIFFIEFIRLRLLGASNTNLDLVDDGIVGGKRDLRTDFCRLDIFLFLFVFQKVKVYFILSKFGKVYFYAELCILFCYYVLNERFNDNV